MPQMPHDLAERIIYAAIAGIQDLPTPRNIWDELRAMFALPHPSVVVVTTILLGLAVGLQAGDGLSMLNQDWSSFLEINEGGWL